MKTQFLITLLLLITGAAFGQEMIGFSGVVKSAQTGNLLEDINVFIEAKNTGTFTNHTGSFFMFLPAGIYDVTFSGEGYKPEKITYDLRKEKEVEIVLKPVVAKKKAEAWLKKKHTNTPDVMTIAGNIEQPELK